MADAAARREARRRKILENSDHRLQKISGRPSHDKPSENDDVLSSKEGLHNTHFVLSNQSMNGMLPIESLVNSQWDEDPLDVTDLFDSDLLISKQANHHSLSSKTNFNHEITRNDNRNNQGSRHQEFLSETFDSNNLYCTTDEHTSGIKKTDEHQSMFYTFFTNRWIYVSLAALMNLIMILQLDSIYGKSIIIPFLLIFATRLYIYGNIPESPKGNMMFAALVLCNIQPSFLHTFQKIMNIFNLIIRDLSLFIFSYILIFCTVTRYWIDVDIYPPEKMEVIVDLHASS